MDPHTEQILQQEVIYLHSLWHQGPPPPPPPPSFPTINLHPSKSTLFKKPKKKKPKKHKVGNFSGKEWPVTPLPENPPLNSSGWPELKLKPNPNPTRLPTPQEVAKHKWNQVQERAVGAVKDFYNGMESDEDEDVNEENEDDGMSEDEENVEEEFFWKLVDGDEEIKDYYVKRCGGGGDFWCLVCGGANEHYRKRYKDCVGLVQHAKTIAKTKRKRSHRGFAKVVCKVLGWDIDRLPSSVVTDCNGGELEGNDVKELNSVMDDENTNGKSLDVMESVDGESMVCEDISAVATVEEENDTNQVLDEAGGYTRGAVNKLEHVINNGAGTRTRSHKS